MPGDLVITEVFADSRRLRRQRRRRRQGVVRDLQRVGSAGVAQGPDGRPQPRPTARKAKSHVMTEVTIAPGQYFALGNTPPDLRARRTSTTATAPTSATSSTPTAASSRSSAATTRSTARRTTSVKAGHSRELADSQPPDYTFNDDRRTGARTTRPSSTTGNFGTPGGENDCTPVVDRRSAATAATMRDIVPPGAGRPRDHRGDAEPDARVRHRRRVVRGQGDEGRRSQRPRPRSRRRHAGPRT